MRLVEGLVGEDAVGGEVFGDVVKGIAIDEWKLVCKGEVLEVIVIVLLVCAD